MNSIHGRATRAWLMATALGVGVPTAAFAQAAPGGAAPGGSTVSEVVVTGSFLPTTPDRIAAPVTTMILSFSSMAGRAPFRFCREA